MTAKKATKRKSPRRKPKRGIPRAPCNPYRRGSGYALVFDVMYRSGREKGMSKKKLIEVVHAQSRKPKRLIAFDCVVVLSPDREGKAHASASSACNRLGHFFEKTDRGQWVKLIIKEKKA